MIVNVKVIPKAKRDLVKQDRNGLKVYVTAPAQKGQANVAVINQLSKYFQVKKYQVNILSGQHSRHKVVEIPQP